MQELKPTKDTLLNIHQLPKNKLVLDYVLSRLGENSSPERYDLIVSLFDMYRTSTGFNPLALSKGRFRRIKATEYKAMIGEIEKDLDTIIHSDQYKQLVAKQMNYQPLFEEFSSLTESLAIHPPYSMTNEVEDFEKKLNHREAYELLIHFYRTNQPFFNDTRNGDNLDDFLSMYDSAYARTHQLYRQSRGSLVLIKHEKDALLGKFNYQAINELFEEFGQLLTLEPNRFTKSDLLSKIIRLGLIFPNPSITLASYIDHVAENLDTIIAQHTEAEQLLCSFVALYHQNSDIDHRYKLLQRAEAFTKDSGKESERAFIKINKALIALDVQDYNTALKALNEAEHLVFRSSWKQALGRNAWIQICEWRSLIFTIMTLRGEEHYTTLLFNDLEKVVNDSSMHRHDSAIISLELNALRYFIDNRRDQALENFEKANNYRCDAIDHPRYLLNSYFIQLLKGASKKGKTTDFKEALINSKAPFYRSACSDLIDLCEKHFKSNKEAILKDE
ncbi:MAG TPA: hypothetical protein PLG57_03400 [Bacteroidia bacterium]|jgi:hypothetical protein|nr:hypothetical protein [Bacteroidia bacterium]HQF27031.1 hypothetical protein [Bacteroidia bacterium]HQK96821.1 hypothetical protein [Bacteroidia bacterium]